MKVHETDDEFSFTRRRLLQGIGTAAAPVATGLPATALAQPTPTFKSPNIREVEGILTGAHWGAFRAIVKDGKFVEAVPLISTPADDLIKATPDIVYSETRIKYPHIRKAFLEKGYKADPAGRGRDEWVRVFNDAYDAFERAASSNRPTLVDAYGAGDPAEFFAVVTESFFERPLALRREHAARFGAQLSGKKKRGTKN